MTNRKYDNSNRAAKATETRERIKQALIRQLIDNNTTEFSVEQAAKDAEVTVRTVFRHFATKEDMLAAVSEGIASVTQQVTKPATAQDLKLTLKQTYSMFEQHEDLVKATLLSQIGRGVRSDMAAKRRATNMQALAPLVQQLPQSQAKAVQAVLCNLLTAETWWNLKSAFEVDGHTAAGVIDWLLSLALAELEKGKSPFSGYK